MGLKPEIFFSIGSEPFQIEGEDEVDGEDNFDWQIEQNIPTNEDISLDAPNYGFGNKKSGVLKHIQVCCSNSSARHCTTRTIVSLSGQLYTSSISSMSFDIYVN